MKKILFTILCAFAFLNVSNLCFAETGMTPIISKYDDQCVLFQTVDETVTNRVCGKMIVDNGSLTDNGDGTWSLSTSGGTGDLLADGTVPMSSNWDMGNFDITAGSFNADNGTYENLNVTVGVTLPNNVITSDALVDDLVFGTFPLTPSSAPDADYEVANKKYVDDLSVSSLTSQIGVLLPFDGDNLSTTFVDEIGNASGLYAFENISGISVLDTSVKKFGISSLKITPTLSGIYRDTGVRATIDSTSVQYFDVFNQALSTDATVSFWLKYDTASAYQYDLNLIEWDTNSGGRSFYIKHQTAIGIYCSNVAGDDIQTNTKITDLNWHHLVFYRSGNIGSFYLDGIQIGYTGALGNQSQAGGGTIDLAQQRKAPAEVATLHFDDLIIDRTNILSLSPNVGLTDTYDVPETPLSLQENKIVISDSSGEVSRSPIFIDDDGNILPDLNNNYDIGSEINKFKDGYFSGTVNTGLIVSTGSVIIGDTNTGGNAGSDLCLGADNTICVCGTCN